MSCDIEKLSLQERIERGALGDNIVSIRPGLNTLDQQPSVNHTHHIDNEDLKGVIHDIHQVVSDYFYTHNSNDMLELCELLERVKQGHDTLAKTQNATSVFDRDNELLDCYYTFIFAGLGKLSGDIEKATRKHESLTGVVLKLDQLSEQTPINVMRTNSNLHTKPRTYWHFQANLPFQPK